MNQIPVAAREAGSLRLRVISALVLIPLALAAVWFGGVWLALIVAVAGAAMAWEWGRLSAHDAAWRRGMVVAATLAAIGAAAGGRFDWALIVLAAGGVAAGAGLRGGVWTAIGTVWIALGCVAFLWLGLGGRPVLLFVLGVTWASDIMAYGAGRALGGPKLAPRLSPNKTWAGFGGGLVGAAAVGAAASVLTASPMAKLVAASLFLGLCAQGGDLVESLAKRHFGVKDASGLIPGHGGFLDRLDGLIAAALAAGLLTAGLGVLLTEID